MEGPTRRKRTRQGVLALTALFLTAVAVPGSAQAYQQIYCQYTVAASPTYCASSGLHSWYFNSAANNSGERVCQYMWNAHNGVVRGGFLGCNYTYTDRTWNRTDDLWYNARNMNPNSWPIYMVGNAIA